MNTILKNVHFPKMVIDFAEQNFNLKMLLSILLAITLFSQIMLLYFIKRGPTVIAIDGNGEVAHIETKISDLQIEAAIKEYISHRYVWDEKSVGVEISKAKFFVLPSLVPSFEKSMIEVQKFVREKKISQRVYPKLVTLDLSLKRVTVLADRITEFESLRAATDMKLTLQFAIEDRTVVNPWGVYITKEIEEGRP